MGRTGNTINDLSEQVNNLELDLHKLLKLCEYNHEKIKDLYDLRKSDIEFERERRD